jgi:hypothetical protein
MNMMSAVLGSPGVRLIWLSLAIPVAMDLAVNGSCLMFLNSHDSSSHELTRKMPGEAGRLKVEGVVGARLLPTSFLLAAADDPYDFSCTYLAGEEAEELNDPASGTLDYEPLMMNKVFS